MRCFTSLPSLSKKIEGLPLCAVSGITESSSFFWSSATFPSAPAGASEISAEEASNKEWKVDFLEYKPQHSLRILPEDEEELTFKKWQKLINSELSERTDGELSDHFDYVMLKVKQEKLSSDDIKELEKLVNEKDAVLCKIQRIIPQLDLSTIQGSQHITSIEDIINRPPLDTLKEAFAIRHNAPMNERQEKMLSDLLTTSSL